MRIRPAAQRYVDGLSNLLRTEISVLDENMERVAGSNQHMAKQARLKTNVAYENGVMAFAMRSGRPQIVEKPREEGVCLGCEARDACIEKYNISVPIVVDGRVCGGVAAIAMTERQLRRMEKSRELYVQTLEHFAEFLALKVREEMEHGANEELADFVEMFTDVPTHALIGISAAGEITMHNAAAGEILALSAEETCPRVYLKREAGGMWRLRLENREYHLRGKQFSVGMKNCAELFVFEQAERGKKQRKNGDFLWGKSPAMRALHKTIAQYARASAPVLITGEFGTEQTALAAEIHEASARQLRPFMSFNCRGEEMQIEHALFGTAPAEGRRGVPGIFERADGGTVCLEHIECLTKPLQLRLLRFLETGELYRCGAIEPVQVHTRVVATSECDLSALTADGSFSAALFYHLAALSLRSLPLREIREDIPLLARRYLFSAALRQGRRIRKIEPEVFSFSAQMDWPGNAVQLKGEMERLVSLMGRDGEIRAAMFPVGTEPQADAAPALWTLDEKEREAIASALLRCGRDSAGKRAAAAELGISLATLYRKMKHYDL